MDSSSYVKIGGIVLLVLGIGLALWGYQMSDSVQSAMSEIVTGSETDKVMGLYIGGGVSFAVGLFLLIKN